MKILPVLVSLFFGVLAAPAARAVCMPHNVLVKALKKSHDETIRIVGQFGNLKTGPLMELFVSPSGSWTMVALTRNGSGFRACIVGAGTSWTEAEKTPDGSPI